MYYARVSFAVGIFPPQLFEYKIPAELAAAVHEGSWVEAVFAHRRLWGVVDNISQTPQFHGKHHELLTAAPSDSELRCWALALSRRLAACYAASLAQAYKTAVAFPFSLERKHSGPHAPDMNEAAAVKNNIALSAQQQEALQTLTENSVGSSKPVYLWGPAGSGKTYVLLRLIQELLRQGRSAIYLVPEISLTPQFIELLQRELSGGHVIAAWHSGVARSRKKTVWEDILAGKTRLVLGTRSAVFLPLKNLGAVILDEEQDGSYKQEMPAPCYHAGEVALWRAKNEKAMAVFASATPSIECYRAIKNGEMICAGLDERYCARPMPIVKILPFEKQDDGLDEAIVTEVKKTIAAGRHVLIYHNRRGFSRILRCEKCKTPVVCSQCRLPLTLHKLQTSDFRLQTSDIKIEGQTKEATHEPANSQTRKLANILRCHHCGIRKNVPQQCAVCGAPAELLKAAGFGTQKIASEIEKLSGCPVSRLDRDTAKHSEPIYADFKSGQSKILVGTKLVAKGWHFPAVTLAVILDADTDLVMPDFRACERAFQSLFQVAGRSGRGEIPGEVLVKTRHPDHYLFKSLETNDQNLFYEKELEIRRRMSLPPFARMFTIELRGPSREKVEKTAEAIFDSLRNTEILGIEALGAGPNYFQKIRKNWRFQVVLRSLDLESPFPLEALGSVVAKHKKSGVSLRLHPDPQNLL